MKVIFLDFDGVLNSAKSPADSGTDGLVIESGKMELLKQIVDATGAEIVLSTSYGLAGILVSRSREMRQHRHPDPSDFRCPQPADPGQNTGAAYPEGAGDRLLAGGPSGGPGVCRAG